MSSRERLDEMKKFLKVTEAWDDDYEPDSRPAVKPAHPEFTGKHKMDSKFDDEFEDEECNEDYEDFVDDGEEPMYRIFARFKGDPELEEIDDADDLEEAEELKREYAMAYGPEATIIIRSSKPRNLGVGVTSDDMFDAVSREAERKRKYYNKPRNDYEDYGMDESIFETAPWKDISLDKITESILEARPYSGEHLPAERFDTTDFPEDDEAYYDEGDFNPDWDPELGDCPHCRGAGFHHIEQDFDGVSRDYDCAECNGTGTLSESGELEEAAGFKRFTRKSLANWMNDEMDGASGNSPHPQPFTASELPQEMVDKINADIAKDKWEENDIISDYADAYGIAFFMTEESCGVEEDAPYNVIDDHWRTVAVFGSGPNGEDRPPFEVEVKVIDGEIVDINWPDDQDQAESDTWLDPKDAMQQVRDAVADNDYIAEAVDPDDDPDAMVDLGDEDDLEYGYSAPDEDLDSLGLDFNDYNDELGLRFD